MLGILRGRWTAKEDQELMALVDRYLAEKGGLTLLRPPPLPRSLPEGNSWSIKDVFHECMALNNPNNPEERRARGFPDWFQGSPEEYEHLVDATVATIPWNQLVLQMTPLPLISTTEDRECQQNERLAMEHVIKDVERGQSNMSQQYSKVPVADSTKDLSPHSSTATMQIPRLPRFGHRLGVQAQARWAEALDPRVRREPWSPIEDSLLRRAVDECAKCWIKISEWMPGRTQRQCRTRWVQLTIKAERAEAKRLARAQTTRRRQ
ncbi:hypothetical protein BGW41_004739 [Actinomortierella wolfii]|nr:hypothetical protein BGW41_004739 [Actinomortierella wolfii]